MVKYVVRTVIFIAPTRIIFSISFAKWKTVENETVE